MVIAGGGTGGHLYPGIAVAQEVLRRVPDARVSFAGTARGLESRIVPREGFELDVLRSAGLVGKSITGLMRGLALLPLSFVDAWRIISRRRPHLVIGVGGYSSGPVVVVAALRRIPTMLLEQNAVPGLTNRLLARLVRAAAVTYEASLPYFRGKGFVTGNPVRAGFFDATDREGEGVRHPSAAAAQGTPPEHPSAAAAQGTPPRRVLVVGGSQGAHAINVAMMDAAHELARSTQSPFVVHQTGERDLEAVRKAYREAGLIARVEPYLDRMDREMREADLIICRAGATTLAELAAAGRPALLIPFPHATDDHQRKNATVLAESGAAEVVEQARLNGLELAGRVLELMRDAPRRLRMATAMRGFARRDAARAIVDRAEQLLRR